MPRASFNLGGSLDFCGKISSLWPFIFLWIDLNVWRHYFSEVLLFSVICVFIFAGILNVKPQQWNSHVFGNFKWQIITAFRRSEFSSVVNSACILNFKLATQIDFLLSEFGFSFLVDCGRHNSWRALRFNFSVLGCEILAFVFGKSSFQKLLSLRLLWAFYIKGVFLCCVFIASYQYAVLLRLRSRLRLFRRPCVQFTSTFFFPALQ